MLLTGSANPSCGAEPSPLEPRACVVPLFPNVMRAALEPIGNASPVEYEMNYYRSQEGSLEMARLN